MATDNSKLPWIEKYRPNTLDEVVGNEETVERLKIMVKTGSLPNLILSGAPGIGKTTSILCLAQEMLGDMFNEAVLELNASDDRGIDVVRDRIKMFAQKKVNLPPGKFKIIILDEADSMTSSAQQALRRTMEIYSNSTRFALACNLSSKIIEPIQSRCAILRYSKLTNDQLVKRLLEVCKLEDVQYSPEGLDALVFTSEGDLRQAVNNLQSTYTGFKFIGPDNVFKVCDSPHPGLIRIIIDECIAGRTREAVDQLTNVWNLGYSSLDIITTLFKVVKNATDIKEGIQLQILKEIGLAHKLALDGMQTLVQLGGLVARLSLLGFSKEQLKSYPSI
ncbi:putative RFC4-DNA replication factor C, 37 kDa subunit [Conidiobolus coronatus NRRL 28638]|uniref:Putative RFC4-DNA replication factor C, 37 kDa subunit n=1 Tax=Conidiobolus coronatus (strain ATCC 28846 / CBS 209.66 / NRRL 28638) TaxID=796925 RepID=A0A137P4N0_CONC2|nr:putative RFC4-DNA replication factor C, 37 kDa subunit [Conidiobolus coronatus NRRL 28638]|eukprot:KXN69874.1 putative RFC4-DNA replication factor C, 37 kDa subunit [Conidiobolus coronatus NRRL 28638]